MKVKALIRQLKKMHPDAEVVFQDHDHDAHEMNGSVDHVNESSRDELIERMGGPVVTLS